MPPMSSSEEHWEHEPPDQGELDFRFGIGQLSINVEPGGQVTIIVDSQRVNVIQDSRIVRGDWNSLEQSLHQHGVSPGEIAELREALSADGEQLGAATQGWIGRLATGARDVAIDVVVKLVRGFLGLS
jgi:hypothetical protein